MAACAIAVRGVLSVRRRTRFFRGGIPVAEVKPAATRPADNEFFVEGLERSVIKAMGLN